MSTQLRLLQTLEHFLPDCLTHRHSRESVKKPFNEQFQWSRCIDCGAWGLEYVDPNQEKLDFLREHGWQWMADRFYHPEHLEKLGFLSLQEAYQIAREMAGE